MKGIYNTMGFIFKIIGGLLSALLLVYVWNNLFIQQFPQVFSIKFSQAYIGLFTMDVIRLSFKTPKKEKDQDEDASLYAGIGSIIIALVGFVVAFILTLIF